MRVIVLCGQGLVWWVVWISHILWAGEGRRGVSGGRLRRWDGGVEVGLLYVLGRVAVGWERKVGVSGGSSG